MKYAMLLLLAVSLNGVASEVGAPYPQLASTATSDLAVAIAETGASTSWATQPNSLKASLKETKEFEMRVEGLDVKMNQDLEALISQKLDSLLVTE